MIDQREHHARSISTPVDRRWRARTSQAIKAIE